MNNPEFAARVKAHLGEMNVTTLPKGAIVAVADLAECYEIVNWGEIKGMESRLVLDENGKLKRGDDGRKIGWHEKPYPDGDELVFGRYDVGNWAWRLENITPLLTPIPYRGNQRLWEVPDEILADALKGAFKCG